MRRHTRPAEEKEREREKLKSNSTLCAKQDTVTRRFCTVHTLYKYFVSTAFIRACSMYTRTFHLMIARTLSNRSNDTIDNNIRHLNVSTRAHSVHSFTFHTVYLANDNGEINSIVDKSLVSNCRPIIVELHDQVEQCISYDVRRTLSSQVNWKYWSGRLCIKQNITNSMSRVVKL